MMVMMEQLIGMSAAYILINCEAGTQQETIGKLNKLSGVVEVSEVNGNL
jgi:hypothetical protein